MFLEVNVDVNQLANQLAKIAAPIAQHGWEIYVRQQYVIGVQQVVASVLLIIVALVLIRLAVFAYKRSDEMKKINSSYDDVGEDATVIVCCVVAAILIVVVIGLAVDSYGHFANPEYGAIQGILGR